MYSKKNINLKMKSNFILVFPSETSFNINILVHMLTADSLKSLELYYSNLKHSIHSNKQNLRSLTIPEPPFELFYIINSNGQCSNY